MKSYQVLSIFLLLWSIVASVRMNTRYDDDDDDQWLEELERALTEARREEKKEPVLNVTVVQRGLFLASVKINFLRNGLQDEFISETIADGTNRVFLLQHNASDVVDHVRIRLSTVAPDKHIGDFQVVHPTANQLCFVLSGTIFHPVYSICAPGENYAHKK